MYTSPRNENFGIFSYENRQEYLLISLADIQRMASNMKDVFKFMLIFQDK
jgi:hypothetical protein